MQKRRVRTTLLTAEEVLGSSESSVSEEDMDKPRAPQTPGGIGQVLDALEPENGEGDTVAEQARDWQIAVEQAENVSKVSWKAACRDHA
jgi:hypothetical protein